MEGVFTHSRIVQPPTSIRQEIKQKFRAVHPKKEVVSEAVVQPKDGRPETTGVDDPKHVEEVLEKVSVADTELRAPIPKDQSETLHSSVTITPSPRSRLVSLHTSNSSSPAYDGDHEHRRETGKGQAHDPLEDTLFLNIGTSAECESTMVPDTASEDTCYVVSESPSTAEFNVYERAYQEEVDRVLQSERGRSATLYLTRRVEDCKAFKGIEQIVDHGKAAAETGRSGWGRLREKVKATKSPAQSPIIAPSQS